MGKYTGTLSEAITCYYLATLSKIEVFENNEFSKSANQLQTSISAQSNHVEQL